MCAIVGDIFLTDDTAPALEIRCVLLLLVALNYSEDLTDGVPCLNLNSGFAGA